MSFANSLSSPPGDGENPGRFRSPDSHGFFRLGYRMPESESDRVLCSLSIRVLAVRSELVLRHFELAGDTV
jgi:hypothetical protein